MVGSFSCKKYTFFLHMSKKMRTFAMQIEQYGVIHLIARQTDQQKSNINQ